MFADIVGYTALMAESEAKGLRARERHRALVGPLVEKYHGEAIEESGDESLAVFPTALDAVNCALAIEEQLAGGDELQLHIGIHVGDFVVEGGEVSGDAVNIAARICSFAKAGVCVSAEVYHSVRNQPNIDARPLGARKLKNVGRPVSLFAIRGTPAAPSAGGVRRSATGEHGPIRSLAVLPLENLSGDPGQEYFADGMTEMLIGDLGKLRALRVISRTSVLRYKGARKPLPEIAAELGVDALLEGTVMREGERVRVTAQLIDGRTDHHLWSERYERDLRGIFELQSDVARAVARKIELELSPAEASRLADRRAVAPAALDALLSGIHQAGQWTPKSMQGALASFERAIELDPGYAPAHAWLAHAWYVLTNSLFVVSDLEGMPKAKSAALRALELDDSVAAAHAVFGFVALVFDWDWVASERHLLRALELDPNLATAHLFYAWHLLSRGRHTEAIEVDRRGAKLDPLSLPTRSNLTGLLYYMGRYEDALEERESFVLEIVPTSVMLAWIYDALGRHEQAIAVWERVRGFRPGQASALRAALSHGGVQGYWREMLRIVRRWPVPVHIQLAGIHALLGERDEAFAELELAYAAREGDLVWVRTFPPGLASLRDDPRFADLVRRIGIPES